MLQRSMMQDLSRWMWVSTNPGTTSAPPIGSMWRGVRQSWRDGRDPAVQDADVDQPIRIGGSARLA